MRVKIFKGADLEGSINSWIDEMEGMYVDFEIIETNQTAGKNDSITVSIWYENELGEIPFLDYDQMDN
jgi:hypothetical protein